MRITGADFQDSFYYPAAGKDFEPLLRFSHLCQRFYFANLFLSYQDVEDYSKRFFEEHQNHLQLLSRTLHYHFKEKDYFELHPDYRQHLTGARFLQDAADDYKSIFRQALHHHQWLLHFRVLRQGVDRIIDLYYFAAEGLATYLVLSQAGRFVPRFFCTIQSGVLERHNGMVLRMFEELNSYPLCWIRGFEAPPHGDIYDAGPSGINDVFKTDALYPIIGLNFMYPWHAEGLFGCYDYQGVDVMMKTARHCKGYVQAHLTQRLADHTTRMIGPHRLSWGSLPDVVRQECLPEYKVTVVLTKNLKKKFGNQFPAHAVVMDWKELVVACRSKRYSLSMLFSTGIIAMDYSIGGEKISLSESLLALDYYVQQQHEKPDYLYFIPLGLDDEGQLLDQWLRAQPEDPTHYHAVVYRPLDFYDLREPKQADDVPGIENG